MQRVNTLVSASIGDTLTNIKTWGTIAYIGPEHGVIEGGLVDTTESLQALVNKAISEGRRTIFLPHITNGQYYVTSLTNADQVDFVGDNSTFVGGYSGTIGNLGGFAELMAETMQVFKPEKYGAVGDGVTDDYQAMQDMVSAVNANGGGHILLGSGKNYYIGRYRIVGGPDDNGVMNLIFSNCNGLIISGYGAKITCKGDFYRSNDYTANGHNYSRRGTVVPMQLNSCKNVLIEGLELDGQVNLTTRDPSVVEGDCYAITLSGCQNVHLRDGAADYFSADGIALFPSVAPDPDLGVRLVCRNITAINFRSRHNARQGITVGHVVGASFIECEFSYTGVTGAYGSHSPMCGIDFEMDWPPEYIDETSKNIEFVNCKLEENLRTFTTVGGAWKNVSLRNLNINSNSVDPAGIYVGGNMSLRDSLINLPNANFNFHSNSDTNERVIIENCNITVSTFILGGNATIEAIIDRNKFVGEIFIQGAQSSAFTNNIVYVPKEKHSGSTFTILTRLQSIGYIGGNSFETDLVPNPNEHFAVVYDGSHKVVNDKYPSNRAFRPSYNSAWIGEFYSYDAGEAWQTATLQNSWTDTLRFCKDAAGNVHLKGVITGGTTTATTTVICTLPVGYRPSVQAAIPVATSGAAGSDASPLIIYVQTNGNIVFEPAAKGAIYMGCSFRLD